MANDYNQTVYLTNLAGAVWNILTDTNTTRASTWSGYPAPTFVLHNAGTLRKSPGSGTNALDGLNVVNTGLLDIQTGGIQFNGSLDNYGEIRAAANAAAYLNSPTTFRTGSTLNAAAGSMINYQASYKLMTFEPGAMVSATTTNRITGYCQFAGTVNLPNFELAAGGGLYGTFTNEGALNWTGGDLNGAITIGSNGVVNLTGSADKRLVQCALNNAGTINWQNGRLVAFATGSGQTVYLTNLPGGLILIQTDTNSPIEAANWTCNIAAYVWANQGTILKTNSPGTNNCDGLKLVNSGLVDVTAGGLSFNNGFDNFGLIRLAPTSALVFNSPATFRTGSAISSTNGGTLEYRGSYKLMTFEPGAACSATLSNRVTGYCQFAGPINLPNWELPAGSGLYGAFTNEGALNWTGGDLNGAITIGSNGVVNLTGSADKRLVQCAINNAGIINWRDGRLVAFATGSGQTVYVTNLPGGLICLLTDTNTAVEAANWTCSIAAYRLINLGTVLKTSAGTNWIQGLNLTNGALVDIQAGGIQFNSGLDNAGELRLAPGTMACLANNSQNVFRSGSAVNTAAGSTLWFDTSRNTFEPGAALTGPGNCRIIGSAAFYGVVAAASLELEAGSLSGTFTNAGNLTWRGGSISGANLTVAPSGVFGLNGAGDLRLQSVVLNNFGTCTWESGRLVQYYNANSQDVLITNAAGGIFNLRASTNTAAQAAGGARGAFGIYNAGTLLKDTPGTTTLDLVNVNNAGTVRVLAGAINFAGGLTNSGPVQGFAGLKALRLAPGQYRLQLTGGVNYAIQVSTNLTEWTELITTNAPAGAFTYDDTNPTRGNLRYYQARIVP